MFRHRLRILCYHGAWIGPGHWGNLLFISPPRFREQMRRLIELGYHPIPLEQALEQVTNNSLPPDAVVITIDDGWYGSYREMLPILAEAKIPFTLYAYTAPIVEHRPVFPILLDYMLAHGTPARLTESDLFGSGERIFDFKIAAHRRQARNILAWHLEDHCAYSWQEPLHRLAKALHFDLEPLLEQRIFHLMTPDELSRVQDFGGTVQLHTHDHRFSSDQPDQNRTTILDNRRELERIVDSRLDHFCYPSGNYQTRIFPLLRELGIKSATTVEAGFVSRRSIPLALPRLCVGEQTDSLQFESLLSGFSELLRTRGGSRS